MRYNDQKVTVYREVVDHNIISRQGIISYLLYFIRTREGQSRFRNAVNKWEEDIDFIAHYKTGSYAKDGIRAIKVAECRR